MRGCEQQRPVSRESVLQSELARVGCDDGAPSPDAQRDAQEARFRPSPAKAAVWAGPFDALWGGQRASGYREMHHAAAAPATRESRPAKSLIA